MKTRIYLFSNKFVLKFNYFNILPIILLYSQTVNAFANKSLLNKSKLFFFNYYLIYFQTIAIPATIYYGCYKATGLFNDDICYTTQMKRNNEFVVPISDLLENNLNSKTSRE